jgi:hypothetical protein
MIAPSSPAELLNQFRAFQDNPGLFEKMVKIEHHRALVSAEKIGGENTRRRMGCSFVEKVRW